MESHGCTTNGRLVGQLLCLRDRQSHYGFYVSVISDRSSGFESGSSRIWSPKHLISRQFRVKLSKVRLQNRCRSEAFESGVCVFERFNPQTSRWFKLRSSGLGVFERLNPQVGFRLTTLCARWRSLPKWPFYFASGSSPDIDWLMLTFINPIGSMAPCGIRRTTSGKTLTDIFEK